MKNRIGSISLSKAAKAAGVVGGMMTGVRTVKEVRRLEGLTVKALKKEDATVQTVKRKRLSGK